MRNAIGKTGLPSWRRRRRWCLSLPWFLLPPTFMRCIFCPSWCHAINPTHSHSSLKVGSVILGQSMTTSLSKLTRSWDSSVSPGGWVLDRTIERKWSSEMGQSEIPSDRSRGQARLSGEETSCRRNLGWQALRNKISREWKWLRTRERRKAYCAWYGGVGEGVNVPRSLADVLPKF